MEKTLEELQAEFLKTFEKEVPVNKKNNAEWIASKIAEAQKAEEEDQITNPDEDSDESASDNNSDDDTEESEFKEDENRFNTEEDYEDEEPDEVADSEDYDDNSVDNQVMTQEARKVGDIVYPI